VTILKAHRLKRSLSKDTLRGVSEDLPVRTIRDPKALRALAHRVRIRLLEALTLAGQATATELSQLVGESPANCSWHLRQLARYGFVEETGGGTGRQRPWRVVLEQHRWDESDPDAELRLAGQAASDVLFGREFEALREWLAAAHAEPPHWRSSAFVAQSAGWLTPDELEAVAKEIEPILLRYLHRVGDPASRPPGSRPVRFVMWGVPARPVPEPEGTPK
jgi:hypothetical protein